MKHPAGKRTQATRRFAVALVFSLQLGDEFVGDRAKGIGGRKLPGDPGFTLGRCRIIAGFYRLAGSVATGAGLFQANVRIAAERQLLFLAVDPILDSLQL